MGTVTLRVGATVWGTTTATPGAVAGTADGDQPYILVVSKRPSVGVPAAESGWSIVSGADVTVNSGGAETGNQGPMRLQVHRRDTLVTGGSITWPAIGNFTGAGQVIGVTPVLAAPAAGEALVAEVATWGQDVDDNATAVCTGAAALALAPADVVVTVGACCDNNVTSSGAAITASGITFGTTTEHQDTSTGNGDDQSCYVHSAAVSSGTATSAPVLTQTITPANANQARVGTVFLRIRSAITNVTGSVTGTTTAGGTVTAQRTQLGSATGTTTAALTSTTLRSQAGSATGTTTSALTSAATRTDSATATGTTTAGGTVTPLRTDDADQFGVITAGGTITPLRTDAATVTGTTTAGGTVSGAYARTVTGTTTAGGTVTPRRTQLGTVTGASVAGGTVTALRTDAATAIGTTTGSLTSATLRTDDADQFGVITAGGTVTALRTDSASVAGATTVSGQIDPSVGGAVDTPTVAGGTVTPLRTDAAAVLGSAVASGLIAAARLDAAAAVGTTTAGGTVTPLRTDDADQFGVITAGGTITALRTDAAAVTGSTVASGDVDVSLGARVTGVTTSAAVITAVRADSATATATTTAGGTVTALRVDLAEVIAEIVASGLVSGTSVRPVFYPLHAGRPRAVGLSAGDVHALGELHAGTPTTEGLRGGAPYIRR